MIIKTQSITLSFAGTATLVVYAEFCFFFHQQPSLSEQYPTNSDIKPMDDASNDSPDSPIFSLSDTDFNKKSQKRETRPIFDLILGILDTFQTTVKVDPRRTKERPIVQQNLFWVSCCFANNTSTEICRLI